MSDNAKRIHKLSPLLINQIAAGEVVTRPASVVKELVENAIDAGADHITVHIEQGGLGLIQVGDNGQGIHPDDMMLAVTRHATSKLADVSELIGIDSLGFRGEALASIAAVSHLTLTSSHDDSGIGRQLSLSGNDASQATMIPITKSRGTLVCVRDLYFNIPARRNNLKSIATEFTHIEQVIQKIAISFAHVQLELYHQNKLRFSLSGENSPNGVCASSLQRLEQALNLPLQANAQPFSLSLQALQGMGYTDNSDTTLSLPQVAGWLFLPSQSIPTSAQTMPKLIYINQRLVTDFAIGQALSKAARQANVDGLGYALFFDLPQAWLNINIHPSKQRVKIQPLTNLLAILNQAVLTQLKPHSQATGTSNDQPIITSVKVDTVDSYILPFHVHDRLANISQPYQAQGSHQVDENRVRYQSNYKVKEDLTSPSAIVKDNIEPPIVLGESQAGSEAWSLIAWRQQVYVMAKEQLHSLPRLSNDETAIQQWLSQAKHSQSINQIIQDMLDERS